MRQLSGVPWVFAFLVSCKSKMTWPFCKKRKSRVRKFKASLTRRIPKKQTKTNKPCRTRPCDKANEEKALARLGLNGIAFFRSILEFQFNKYMRAVCIACLVLG